jgi:tRNA 2-thiouridine synthesizing protein B
VINRSESLNQEQYELFLLTKPPLNPRSELCLKLASLSGNARIYLAGDGVYHLLTGIEEKSEFRIYACKEDLEARAIRAGEKVIIPDDFYAALIVDVMEHCRHEYTF